MMSYPEEIAAFNEALHNILPKETLRTLAKVTKAAGRALAALRLVDDGAEANVIVEDDGSVLVELVASVKAEDPTSASAEAAQDPDAQVSAEA
jgi:hypothetical protein